MLAKNISVRVLSLLTTLLVLVEVFQENHILAELAFAPGSLLLGLHVESLAALLQGQRWRSILVRTNFVKIQLA